MLNGIAIDKYRFSYIKRDEIRQQYGISEKFVVGNVGRFTQVKNHAFLLEIFSEVLKKNTESILMLVGAGQEEKNIKKKASELGISNSIIYVGETTHVSDFMAAMDVLCFPSLHEGLGIVAIEAQAMSLRVVASNAIPQEANISSYITFLSLDKNPKEWAEEVVKRGEEYSRDIDNTQMIKNAGFDIRESAKSLEQIYRRLMEETE